MATLAKHLKAKGITLKNPYGEYQKAQRRARGQETSESEGEQSAANKSVQFEDDTVEMPEPILKTPSKATNGLDVDMSGLSINDGPQCINGSVSFPIITGRWERFDHVNGVMKKYCMLRMLTHAGSKQKDFQIFWIDKKTIKIRLKWPTFMQKCLMMTGLDTERQGMNSVEVFPEDHKVYDSMGQIADEMKSRDGCIWSEGVFRFKNSMEEEFSSKVFNPEIDANNNDGTILQIVFQEKVAKKEADGFRSPSDGGKGSIKFSKSNAPAAASRAVALIRERVDKRTLDEQTETNTELPSPTKYLRLEDQYDEDDESL